jgi:hypothetical protein
VTPDEQQKHDAWVRRIFGTPESYAASLPSRRWERTDSGWASVDRAIWDSREAD